MKRISTRSVLTLAAAVAVAAFSGGACGKMAEPAKGEPIKVGHFGSLTGSEATFGQGSSKAIRLAIKDFNAAGGLNGRPIALTEYDTRSDLKEAANVVTRMVTNDKVVAVLGEVASGRSLAGAPICQENGVPMITPSSTNPRVTKVGDMIFRVCFIDPFQGYVCAKFAAENQKARSAAILFDQAQPYSTGLASEFKKNFVKFGGKIATEQTYNGGDQDFTAQLQRIKGAGADIIFIPGYYTEVGNIAIQARKLGITAALLGGDGWESPKLAEIGGTAIDGAFYSNHYSPDDPSPVIQNFIKRFKAEYDGETPDSVTAQAYDATNFLFDAMKRAKSLKGTDLRDAIAATKDFKGVTGNITIDKDRNAVKAAVILQMKGGIPVYVTTINPEK
ncbi:MAG: ABC transporter substrate-binding protein [Phycisphaerales bacterium]